MNWKVLLAGLLLVVPLILVLASGFGTNPRGSSNALEGRQAPTFSLESLQGDAVNLAAHKGTPVVLNFWSTWCQPCKLEHAHLLEAARTYTRRGVSFYGVLYADDTPTAKAFLKRQGEAYPTLEDPNGRVAIDYGVAGVPETFIIAPDGTIARKFTGPITFPVLAQALEELL